MTQIRLRVPRWAALLLGAVGVALAATLATGLLSSPASAVPTNPHSKVTLQQPDGTKFIARLWGDEWYHEYRTNDGYTIRRNRETGFWTYAVRSDDGRLVASRRAVGVDEKPARVTRRMLDDVKQDRAVVLAQAALGPVYPASGPQRQLVILASYANTNPSTTAATWSSRFFGSTNSVDSYYREVSYGRFGVVPAAETSGTYADGVVGWVKISSLNGPVGSLYNNVYQQIAAAIRAADPHVNFANYDTDRDGYVEPNELHVTIISAGKEQAVTACNSPGTVWAHKNSLGSAAPTLDSTRVGFQGYTIFGELHCTPTSTYPATVGVIAHELGHDLGMPDLYDTDKSSRDGLNGGVGQWSLMAGGTWNYVTGQRIGESPAHLDAFMKTYMGWVTPQQVTGTVNGVTLADAERNARVVRVRANPNGVDWSFGSRSGSGEYFLVENRQRVGFDRGLNNCGVLIWHVNEAAPYNTTANANENGVRLLDLEEGDNNSYPFNAADVWTSARGQFNDSSAPNARLYSGTPSGVRVTTVSTECSPTMTVNLSDGGTGTSPTNDAYVNATTVSSLPYGQSSLVTTSATKETGEPLPSCDATIGRTLWWKFTPATSMRVKAETTGSNFDTVLAAWQLTNGGANLNQVGCNDDAAGAGGPSAFEVDLLAGQTYYFQAGGFGGAGGTMSFAVNRVTNAPANDDYAQATGIGALPYTAAVVTTDATSQTGEPAPDCGTLGKTAWWKYTPTTNVKVKAETTGSNFDTVLAAWQLTNGGANLSQVGCNDDAAGAGGSSAFEVNLLAGQTYYFQAGGFNDNGTVASGSLTFKVSQVTASPTANNFAQAVQVTALPFSNSTSNVGATLEAGEPVPSCGAVGATVWYKYTPSQTLAVTADTSTSGSGFDTVLAAYRGTNLGGLTEVGCNDDVPGQTGTYSTFTVTLTAGQTYYFQAGGYKNADGSVAVGTLGFRISTASSPDNFASATTVSSLPFAGSGSNAAATSEAGEPAPACAPIGKTIWHRYTPNSNQAVTFSTGGSNFDTVLAVWQGTSIGTLSQVGCNDDGLGTGGASQVASLALTAGQTYYVQVGGYREAATTASGSYQLSISVP